MYQTELEYTYSEYMKLQKKIYGRRFNILFVMIGIIVVLIMGFSKELNQIIYFSIAFFSIVPLLIQIIVAIIGIKIGWALDKITDTTINKYTFFEHHLEMKNDTGTYYVNYHDIYRIIETKTHFYLEIDKYHHFIIKKENCCDELIEFIRNYKNKTLMVNFN